MIEKPSWTSVLWPTAVFALNLHRFSARWESHFFKALFCLVTIWLVFAWFNFLSRGKLTAWLEGRSESLEIPDDFHQFCLGNPVSPGLRLYLSHLLEGGSPFDDKIESLDRNFTISSPADALAVCAAFKQNREAKSADPIARLFNRCGSQEAFAIFYQLGMPQLHKHVEKLDARRKAGEKDNDLLGFIPILTGYGHSASFPLIEELAHHPETAGSYWWTSIFGSINLKDAETTALIERFTRRLPDDFAAIAFLDWANESMIGEKLDDHPFDHPAGISLLTRYLSDPDPEHHSYAVSATAALPFLKSTPGLFDLAAKHPEQKVRIEAAWARAKIGDETGIEELVRICGDWRTREIGARYLDELGHAARIPAEARQPREAALGAMAHWLSHPNELGELPESLEIVDHREIFWPPGDERIPVTLLRWKLRDDSGIGMVGSVTWCFFFGTFDSEAPLEIYARHCAWELEKNDHPKAVATAAEPAHSLALLEEANPGQNWTATG
jgi:HEAT repeats